MTRVIIPAAGLGQRLMPHTAARPKCLVPVRGRPIIEHLMTQLNGAGVDDVILVAGYRYDMVVDFVTGLKDRPPVTFVRNPRFESTNSIVSLQAAFDHWDGELTIVDSDILVSDRLLRLVLGVQGNALVLDGERSPVEIDMAAEVRDGAIWHLDKELPPERVSGEFFGLSHWSVEGARTLRAEIDDMISRGETGVWYQFAIRTVAKRMAILPLQARRDEWTEIDDGDDLVAAEAAADAAEWGVR